ncbi:MAG: hypothetical protein IPP47_26080 [Bryobacterales bacterium]|nr:hypothetical protein [Bryobacterales bacterium]
MKKAMLLIALLAGLAQAQSASLLFDGVKLFYQKPGETKWRDDKALLALDGGQRVMLLLKDNKPLFVMRYDNISSMSFNEKKDRTLTLTYGGDSSPSGTVRMELSGKWKEILETLRGQSQKPVAIVAGK